MEGLYSSLVSGLFSTVLSIIVMLLINIFFLRRSEETSFRETRMELNVLALQEPFLRSDDLLEEFLVDGEDKENAVKLKKYDLLCLMTCDYLKNICEFYGYNNRRKFVQKYNFRQNIDSKINWLKANHDKNIGTASNLSNL